MVHILPGHHTTPQIRCHQLTRQSRGIARLDNTALNNRITALITDKIIRGVHQTELFQTFGIIPVTKVAVKSSAVGDETDPSTLRDIAVQARAKKGKTVKSVVYPRPPTRRPPAARAATSSSASTAPSSKSTSTTEATTLSKSPDRHFCR